MTCHRCGREVHYIHHIDLEGGWLDLCERCYTERKGKE